MKNLVIIFLILLVPFNYGCIIKRNIVTLAGPEECPRPDKPVLHELPSDASKHLCSKEVLSIKMDNYLLIENYSTRQDNTIDCYKAAVERYKKQQKN